MCVYEDCCCCCCLELRFGCGNCNSEKIYDCIEKAKGRSLRQCTLNIMILFSSLYSDDVGITLGERLPMKSSPLYHKRWCVFIIAVRCLTDIPTRSYVVDRVEKNAIGTKSISNAMTLTSAQ